MRTMQQLATLHGRALHAKLAFLGFLGVLGCSSAGTPVPPETATLTEEIVFGTEVNEGVYPWIVAPGGCTAALISPHFVLSAAHCFAEPRNAMGTLEGVDITTGPVSFGHPDLTSPAIERRNVKRVYLHPEYAKLTLDEVYGKEPYDHALLELEQPIQLERYPKLPTRPPSTREEVMVAGWGLTENGGGSDVLLETTREVKPSSDCFGDSIRFCTTSSAAHPQSNIDSGDSGGPVFVKEADFYMILGVNSTGGDTDASHATSFEFLPWILEVAAHDFDACGTGQPNCSENATCANTTGGFECQCHPGYNGDGVTCSDIDECTAGLQPCRADQVCKNSSGAFSCACPPGFSDPNDGTGCAREQPPAAGGSGNPMLDAGPSKPPSEVGSCRVSGPGSPAGVWLWSALWLASLSRIRRRSAPRLPIPQKRSA